MKKKFMSDDPWSKIVSKNGIPADELISALQKTIRRGMERDASMVAYEMYISSPQLEEKLWRRLLAISVEDVGFGDTNAPILLNSVFKIKDNFPYNDPDRPIFFIHAIRYLCNCKKDRDSDHLKNITIKRFSQGFVPEIPDFAIDMHTQRGISMGRDEVHFLKYASEVKNEIASKNNYKTELLKIIEDSEKLSDQVSDFQYNSWQF